MNPEVKFWKSFDLFGQIIMFILTVWVCFGMGGFLVGQVLFAPLIGWQIISAILHCGSLKSKWIVRGRPIYLLLVGIVVLVIVFLDPDMYFGFFIWVWFLSALLYLVVTATEYMTLIDWTE